MESKETGIKEIDINFLERVEEIKLQKNRWLDY